MFHSIQNVNQSEINRVLRNIQEEIRKAAKVGSSAAVANPNVLGSGLSVSTSGSSSTPTPVLTYKFVGIPTYATDKNGNVITDSNGCAVTGYVDVTVPFDATTGATYYLWYNTGTPGFGLTASTPTTSVLTVNTSVVPS